MKKLTKEQFIEKARKIHGDKYDYSKVNYINNSTKVCIICPEHGEFRQTPNAHLSGHSCPTCNESQGEKKIRVWLDNNDFNKDEDYILQYRDEWFDSLTLDFYFPNLKIGIEYDGIQHFEPIDAFGGEEEFKNVQERDNRKNLICEQNGIKLIRIPYTDFDNMENILKEALSPCF